LSFRINQRFDRIRTCQVETPVDVKHGVEFSQLYISSLSLPDKYPLASSDLLHLFFLGASSAISQVLSPHVYRSPVSPEGLVHDKECLWLWDLKVFRGDLMCVRNALMPAEVPLLCHLISALGPGFQLLNLLLKLLSAQEQVLELVFGLLQLFLLVLRN